MTALILALDGPEPLDDFFTLREPRLRWVKLNNRHVIDPTWSSLVREILTSAKLFLDFKLADTAEATRASVTRYGAAGVASVSVTLGLIEPARRAAEGSGTRVWALLRRTDQPSVPTLTGEAKQAINDGAHGLICPAYALNQVRNLLIPDVDLVVAGVRIDPGDAQGHLVTASPTYLRTSGVSHAVVGRPIVAAARRAEALKTYLDALEDQERGQEI